MDVVYVLPLNLAVYGGREYLVLRESRTAVRLGAPGWKSPNVGWESDGWWARDVHPRSIIRFERVEYDARYRGMPVAVSTSPFGGVRVHTTDEHVAAVAGIPSVSPGEYALDREGWIAGLDARVVRRTRTRFAASDRALPRDSRVMETDVEDLANEGRLLDSFAAHYALGATVAMLQPDLEALLHTEATGYLDALTRLSLAVALDAREDQFAKAAAAAAAYADDVAIRFLLASRDPHIPSTAAIYPHETARALARILTSATSGVDARAYLDARGGWAFELVGFASLLRDVATSVRNHPRLPNELVNPFDNIHVSLDPARVQAPPFPNVGGPRVVGTYRDLPATFAVTPQGFLAASWIERPTGLTLRPPPRGGIDAIVASDDPDVSWRIAHDTVP